MVLGLGTHRLIIGQADSSGPAPVAGAARASLPTVDVVLAREGSLRSELEYTGSTRATREVALRARTEGRLLDLTLDVGDPVRQGQVVARLDDVLLRNSLRQAEAELDSRRSEVMAARNRVSEARTQVEQARLDLHQKRSDFDRVWRLWGQGFESRQAAEQAKTATRIAEQVVRSQEEQVRNLQSAVSAATSRVAAQEAVVRQERERLSYSVVKAPITGFVTARLVDTGDLIGAGGEIVRIGDFRLVQVDVEVSDLELAQVSVGQPARVRFDAVAEREFVGRVDRISPQADPLSRLIPVTVTVENPDGRVGAGLLARVRFGATGEPRVLIPESALTVARGRRAGAATSERTARDEPQATTVFVAAAPDPLEAPLGAAPGTPNAETRTPEPEAAGSPLAVTRQQLTVQGRPVVIGTRADGQVEVLSGLRPGDRVISRSSRPLKVGDTVLPSILSAEALAESAPPPATSRPGGVLPPPPSQLPRGSGAPSSTSTGVGAIGGAGGARGGSTGSRSTGVLSPGGGATAGGMRGGSSSGSRPSVSGMNQRTGLPSLPAPTQGIGSELSGAGRGFGGSNGARGVQNGTAGSFSGGRSGAPGGVSGSGATGSFGQGGSR